mmetsp:Transcript_43172/g.92097  ORF Transcript_43172/g.92097 Transcript_43172/m.92097 type:complete len:279 (-) Transcript_43172:8-844(-)
MLAKGDLARHLLLRQDTEVVHEPYLPLRKLEGAQAHARRLLQLALEVEGWVLMAIGLLKTAAFHWKLAPVRRVVVHRHLLLPAHHRVSLLLAALLDPLIHLHLALELCAIPHGHREVAVLKGILIGSNPLHVHEARLVIVVHFLARDIWKDHGAGTAEKSPHLCRPPLIGPEHREGQEDQDGPRYGFGSCFLDLLKRAGVARPDNCEFCRPGAALIALSKLAELTCYQSLLGPLRCPCGTERRQGEGQERPSTDDNITPHGTVPHRLSGAMRRGNNTA